MSSNLERHIKQTQPFQNEYVKGMVGLIYLTNQVYDKHQQFFKAHGITVQQYNVLRILRGKFPDPSNINAIKERMLDKMCDASRIVDRLVKLNLATKSPNPNDKRNSDVSITEKALNLLTQIDVILANHETLLHKLSKEEITEFNRLINVALDY